MCTFTLYESTGKVVDVSGFHDTFDAIRNIQVGTCITAIDLNGETIIASFPQSLYFGDSMEHSLVPLTTFVKELLEEELPPIVVTIGCNKG